MTNRIYLAALTAFLSAACAREMPLEKTAGVIDLSRYDVIDLSHEYSEETIYWPTAPSRFEKTTIFEGAGPDGRFYSAFSISTPEHGGTHLDAPYHFHQNGDKAADVPLERLIGPVVVIDVTNKTAADPDYRLTPEDVLTFEARHGEIAPGTIVFLKTGWSRRWPDAKAYLGGADLADLSFPSFGPEAVRLLIEERNIAALGVDTASTDYGRSSDFPVHRIMGAANVPGFENLTNLDRLPPTGATVFALPMKIAGGSGGPLRAIALVPAEN